MGPTDALTSPICEEWITPPAASTASELAVVVGRYDAGALAPWHDELATAVNELRRDRICAESAPTCAGQDRPWDVSDPIVALVRAVAFLARRNPSAASPAARLLVDLLGSDGRGQSPSAS